MYCKIVSLVSLYMEKSGVTFSCTSLEGMCQGCSLRLTGTRGLVVEGGVKGVVNAFRG